MAIVDAKLEGGGVLREAVTACLLNFMRRLLTVGWLNGLIILSVKQTHMCVCVCVSSVVPVMQKKRFILRSKRIAGSNRMV